MGLSVDHSIPNMPALGSIVLLHRHSHEILAALVAYSNPSDHTLKVGVFNPAGENFGACSVPFVAPGEDPPETGPYCALPV